MNLTSAWLVAFLAVLCALPWLVKWIQRKTGRGPLGTDKTTKLISVLAVGPQQRVMTVEVGSGRNRTQLVLGVTAQSITCLHTLPVDAVQPVPVPPRPVSGDLREPSFSMELKEHTVA